MLRKRKSGKDTVILIFDHRKGKSGKLRELLLHG